jgi:hypothetical protein
VLLPAKKQARGDGGVSMAYKPARTEKLQIKLRQMDCMVKERRNHHVLTGSRRCRLFALGGGRNH